MSVHPLPPTVARTAASLVAALSVTLGLARVASGGQVQQITSFGSNPTGIGMYLYTPTNVTPKPAVLVGVHACHGRGTDVCTQGGGWVAQADKYGFLLICPSAVSADGCWDVHSTGDLTHSGAGDAGGIISMVNYVLQNKNGDANRVYVAGHSSGGMMTNVLIGSYPDVFKAGAAFAGVAFGCYAIGTVDSLGWNSSCANGNVTQTGMQWADMVRAAYPAFTGTRPRIQLWHGTTDAILNFRNFGEEIKEWTNVLGLSATPTSTENNAIQTSWIRTRYMDSLGVVQVEAIQETGQPHNLVVNQAEAIHFFGLDGTGSVPDGGATGGGPEAGAGTGDSGGTDGGGTEGGSGGGRGAIGAGNGGVPAGDSGGQPANSGSSGGSGFDGSAVSEGGGMTSSGAVGPVSGPDASTGDGTAPAGGGHSNGCSIADGAGQFNGAERDGPFGLLLVAGACWNARRRRGRKTGAPGPLRRATGSRPSSGAARPIALRRPTRPSGASRR